MAEILAVEDNSANLSLLHAILAREGYTLHDARTLAEARELLATRKFDLILLDVRLPDGSGLDLAREIRAGAATTTVPIIVVSASVLPAEQSAALEAGCNDFMSKPILPQQLLTAVESALAQEP